MGDVRRGIITAEPPRPVGTAFAPTAVTLRA